MHNMHTTQPPGALLVVESYRAQLSESSKYRSIAGFERDMPYFCLRMPTGGGKTWLAARSVPRRRRNPLRGSVLRGPTPSFSGRDLRERSAASPSEADCSDLSSSLHRKTWSAALFRPYERPWKPTATAPGGQRAWLAVFVTRPVQIQYLRQKPQQIGGGHQDLAAGNLNKN